jgi:hypothetical protein
MPIRGHFKRTMIGNCIRYGIELSLEQLSKLHALMCPLHLTWSGSDRHMSTRRARSPNASGRARKIRSVLPSVTKVRSVHTGGRQQSDQFERDERLLLESDQTCLPREERGVAKGVVLYKAKDQSYSNRYSEPG